MLERLELLFNDEEVSRFANASILLVGLGGVGGACFEALVRMGLRNITIIDKDCFDESNLNRQLLSNINNIGHSKVNEAVLRAKSINPDIFIEKYEMFLDASNLKDIEVSKFDYVIDCCDTVTTKVLLIIECIKNNVKVISCMGTGNRVDPTKLEIMDIRKTSYDPLAKIMRKLLRENGINKKVMVLCSTEKPLKISSRTVGSTAFVPNSAGFCIASYVFNDIINMGSDNYGRK
jgi:tRNA A37 threonylcarbamoyladenosine dehydratase